MDAATNIVQVTFALLLALSQAFSDGMQAFRAARWREADAAFTRVIDAGAADNPLAAPALYWRARCRARAGDLAAATNDLGRLIRRAKGGALVELALADFQKETGAAWDGPGWWSPQATLATLRRAEVARDFELVRQSCTGGLLTEVRRQFGEEGEFWANFSAGLRGMTARDIRYNAASNQVCLRLASDEAGVEVVMDRIDGAWLLSSDGSADDEDPFTSTGAAGEGGAWQVDQLRLGRLAEAVAAYFNANERVPLALENAAAYDKQFETDRVSAITGKPWIYVVVLAKEYSPPWIVMSPPVGGRRQGHIGGQTQILQEPEFRALRREMGVEFPHDEDPGDLTDAERAELRRWIGELGSESYRVRRAAHEALRKAGAKAGAFLDEAARSDDPEVAQRARELLLEL